MATESFFNPMNIVNPTFTPPIDKSSIVQAKGFENAIEIGKGMIDTYGTYKKNVALQEIESDYTKTIQDYESQSPTYQSLVNKSIQSIQDEINNVKGSGKPAADIDTQVNILTSQLNSEYAKLTKARQQGTITPLELEARLDQLTRDKVAQNPAFRKEIIAHAASTKDLLGISTIVAKDVSYYNEIAAQEKENRTRLMNEANQYHLDLNDNKYKNIDGSLNPVAINYEINDKRGKIGAYEAIQLLGNTSDVIRKVKLQQEIDNGNINKIFEGGLLTLQINLDKVWSNPSLNIEQKIKLTDGVLIGEQSKVTGLLTKFGNAQELQPFKENFNSLLKDIKDNYKNIGSGKEMKDFVETRLAIIKANQGIGLNQVVNTTQMNFIADTVQKMGPAGISQDAKLRIQNDLLILSDAFTQSNLTGILQVNPEVTNRMFSEVVNTTTGKTKAGIALDSAHDIVLKGDPSLELYSQQVSNYENMLKLHAQYSADPKVSKNESLKISDKIMLELGSSSIKNKNIPYTDSFKADMDANITSYAKRVGDEIANLRGKPDGVVLGLNPDGTLKATADPNIKVSNPSLQQSYISRFNSIIVNRINNSMKAYATIHGSTTQSISAEFIRNYYGSVFSNLNKAPGNTDTFTDKQKEANAIIGE
jgi:hypothetical protein